MPTLILDATLEQLIRAARETSGADRYDEVWEGTLMMAPLADDEHQALQTQLGAVLQVTIGWPGLGEVRTGVNVSDREVDWIENYRIPDVAVFLPSGAARNCGTHWVGGPDFAIEILSPGDRSRDKLDFYHSINVRELLLIDRYPWALEFYVADRDALRLTSRSDLSNPAPITSRLLSLTFRLLPGIKRPGVEVNAPAMKQSWVV